MSKIYKTAEAVSIAHPDKVCDQISDAILDECLKQDPFTRSAIEVLGGHGSIIICGELTTNAKINIRNIANKVYRDCGYDDKIGIFVNVVEQSPEIKKGVDIDGAGDQGIMVGYATSETDENIPLEVLLSRKLAEAMGKCDGKSQVTVCDGKVVKILTSLCKNGTGEDDKLDEAVKKYIVPHLDHSIKNVNDIWLKNPNGDWFIGGFNADTGLTGRKLAIDNYGPNIPIGGGCFSGKDATKVDRSGAYMARKIAVDYLKKRNAKEVFVHIAYAIGVADPLMAVVSIDGVQENVEGYDLKPKSVIELLKLREPIFYRTSQYGHFGNGFEWDK